MDSRASRIAICAGTLDLVRRGTVAVAARLLHFVRDESQRHAEGDDAAQRLWEAEADEKSDDRPSGDELRYVFGRQRLKVERRAQLAIERVDAGADPVPGAFDFVFDRLFLVLRHFNDS